MNKKISKILINVAIVVGCILFILIFIYIWNNKKKIFEMLYKNTEELEEKEKYINTEELEEKEKYINTEELEEKEKYINIEELEEKEKYINTEELEEKEKYINTEELEEKEKYINMFFDILNNKNIEIDSNIFLVKINKIVRMKEFVYQLNYDNYIIILYVRLKIITEISIYNKDTKILLIKFYNEIDETDNYKDGIFNFTYKGNKYLLVFNMKNMNLKITKI